MTITLKTGMLAVALLILGGCASAARSNAVAMPTPAPGDAEGQIMSRQLVMQWWIDRITGPRLRDQLIADHG